MKQKKYYIETTTEGCATNLIENSMYSNYLENNELLRTDDPNSADIIVINTCAFTSDQEQRSLDTIENYKNKYKDKEVIAGGCLTKINPKKFSEIAPQKKGFLPGDLKAFSELVKIPYNEDKAQKSRANFFNPSDFKKLTHLHKIIFFLRTFYFAFEKFFKTKFFPLHNIVSSAVINEEFFTVTVSQGCAGKCTFCAIKFAKGHVKSKPIVEVLHEIQQGIAKGQRKIWLLGDDIGCFGIDNDENIMMLLREILKIPVDFELVINYFEPYFLIKHQDEIQEIFSDKRIVNINIPIQSGNNEIIKAMGRDYRIEDVNKAILSIKDANPSIAIKTNIILGFPGEKTSDFFDSAKSIFYFDAIYALKFTPKEKTRAKEMHNQIGPIAMFTRNTLFQTLVIIRHLQVTLYSFLARKTV